MLELLETPKVYEVNPPMKGNKLVAEKLGQRGDLI